MFTGNTAATQAFIPHIDAALVVIGADPPLAGEELVLVEAVADVQDLIFTGTRRIGPRMQNEPQRWPLRDGN